MLVSAKYPSRMRRSLGNHRDTFEYTDRRICPENRDAVGFPRKDAGSNRKKHGVDFRTAAKVFLDPYVIEFDDLDARGELRFNAIGQVDGRMLFVTYTMRGDVVRILSARGAEPHEKRKYHEI
jgi:uncharacterized protein